jgi:hypothetical protein
MHLTSSDVALLQRTVGNVAVVQMLGRGGSSRIHVGPRHDRFEREADQISRQVVATHGATPPFQRSSEATVQRQSVAPDGARVDAGFESRLQRAQSGGRVLPGSVRGPIEAKLGADLSPVKVHTDKAAVQMSREIGAKAFTHGKHIYYGAGQSPHDMKLTAHEAVHTVQQGAVPQAVQRTANAHTSNVTHPTSRTPTQIQRYPANVFDEPGVNWLEETKSVKKSGEGVSGGVYFFQGKGGPINKVVVKPEFAAQADSTSFPDQFIKSMGGIKIPDARLVSPEATEANVIMDTARAFGSEIPTTMKEQSLIGDETEKNLLYFKIMATAQGSSISSDSHKVSDVFDVNELIEKLNKREILFNVGRLIAFDAFMGNRDRVSKFKANLGNIMYNGKDITAIDSGAELKKYSGRIGFQLADIENLFSSQEELMQVFISGIAHAIESEELKADPYTTYPAAEHFKNYFGLSTWQGWLSSGMQQGITDITTLFSSRSRRGERKELKSSAKDWEERGGKNVNWDTVRTNEFYLRQRQAGVDEQEATTSTNQYAEYRRQRAAKPKGLKWTAKLSYLMKKRFGRRRE